MGLLNGKMKLSFKQLLEKERAIKRANHNIELNINKKSIRQGGRLISGSLACLLLIVSIPYAFAETASYYTYQSCVREGTSGVWTASGERFDENDLTAAMWGVKFGTRVRVTNLANNKSVVVRINDRGPSKKLVKKGRVIDLSKGAFLKIAELKKGVITVKVEVL